MTAVLSPPRERHSRFSPDPLRSPTAQRYFLDGPDVSIIKSPMHDYSPSECTGPNTPSDPSSILPSPDYATDPDAEELSPYTTPTTLSSLSLAGAEDLEDDEILLPSYDTDQGSKQEAQEAQEAQKEPEDVLSEVSAELSTDFQRDCFRMPAADDASIEEEPSRHVDYLSHEWKEEDVWSSWRYVVSRRIVYSNGPRLENASWRTWAKLKSNLGTVSPETLNWLKDCDVTWLYGPLKTCSHPQVVGNASPPPSCLETPNLDLDRKSILKKKTASEAILQRSLSQHTLLQHAGAILKAQEAENGRGRPSYSRSSTSTFGHRPNHSSASASTSIGNTSTDTTSSGVLSPNSRRHIHFNNEVVQCIAVEGKDGDEEENDWPTNFDDDLPWDDDITTMKHILPESQSPVPSSRNSSRNNSVSSENKTIAPLPPTTLKYRGDTPEPASSTSIMGRWSGSLWKSALSSKPSTETLRPSEPSANFLLDADDDIDDLDANWHVNKPAGDYYYPNRPWFVNPADEAELDPNQRLAPIGSDMFASFEDGESLNAGIFDRVVDTVNTARDIAHVIWNVGWRR